MVRPAIAPYAGSLRKVAPALRPEDHNMPLLSWIDPENFNPNYLMRDMHLLPRRGDKAEWQHSQEYWTEQREFDPLYPELPLFAEEPERERAEIGQLEEVEA